MKQKTTSQKKVFITLLVVLVLLLAAGTYIAYAKIQESNNTNSFSETTSENLDPTEAKENSEETYNNTTTDQVPETTNTTVNITTLKQEGGQVIFNASVTSSAQDRKCSLTFTNPNDKPVSRTVDATISSDSSVCGPISIPTEEFALIGEWTATLRYYSNGAQAIASKTIDIK